MDWRNYISTDPTVCHGRPCVAGTRIPVSVVLENLAAGLSSEQIQVEYPSVTERAVRAAIAYAAELSRGRVAPLAG